MTGDRAPGRPRSEQSRAAILAAALALVERDGYAAVTIKGIAEAAGVGRQTVYRWWQSKGEVVLEAVVDQAIRLSEPAPTGNALADLYAVLSTGFALQRVGPVLRGLMAEALMDGDFAGRLRTDLLNRRRMVVREVLLAGQRRGELAEGIDIEFAIDIVFGVLWYRVLNQHAPVDEHLAAQLTEVIGTLMARPTGPDAKPATIINRHERAPRANH